MPVDSGDAYATGEAEKHRVCSAYPAESFNRQAWPLGGAPALPGPFF